MKPKISKNIPEKPCLCANFFCSWNSKKNSIPDSTNINILWYLYSVKIVIMKCYEGVGTWFLMIFQNCLFSMLWKEEKNIFKSLCQNESILKIYFMAEWFHSYCVWVFGRKKPILSFKHFLHLHRLYEKWNKIIFWKV